MASAGDEVAGVFAQPCLGGFQFHVDGVFTHGQALTGKVTGRGNLDRSADAQTGLETK